MPPISIVVPVYNEGQTVAKVLNELKKELDDKIIYEIIAVNDGSSDNSKETLETLSYIRLINHKINRGYGSALKTGIENSRYEWILTFDSDGSHPSSQIMNLASFSGEYDLIIGARTAKNSHDTVFRKTGRKIVTAFAQYISKAKIEDINSGFRLFKKDLAKKFWNLYPDGFSFSTTLTVASHVAQYPVKYVQIEAYKRKGGKSGIKPAKDMIGFLSIVARLAMFFKPLRVFAPLSALLFCAAFVSLALGWILFGGILDTTFAILIMASIQTLTFGLIAEMIVRRFYN